VAERDWAAEFSATFSMPASPVSARIWREVMGDEYPAELETFSFVSRTELAKFVRDLAVGPESLFADIGCGRGGPGLWVAAQTGASLIGIDIASAAVAAAEHRAAALGLGERARFQVGTFEATGLADASLDAAMSVDALLFAPDKMAAARELARVLKPGARLCLTTWDYGSQPASRPPQVPDHRPVLAAAGFALLAYDETESWRERQTDIDLRLLDAADELARESGEDPVEVRAGIEEMHATLAHMTRRVYVVAELAAQR
jgi:SAM-dependent methyltransferase